MRNVVWIFSIYTILLINYCSYMNLAAKLALMKRNFEKNVTFAVQI